MAERITDGQVIAKCPCGAQLQRNFQDGPHYEQTAFKAGWCTAGPRWRCAQCFRSGAHLVSPEKEAAAVARDGRAEWLVTALTLYEVNTKLILNDSVKSSLSSWGDIADQAGKAADAFIAEADKRFSAKKEAGHGK